MQMLSHCIKQLKAMLMAPVSFIGIMEYLTQGDLREEKLYLMDVGNCMLHIFFSFICSPLWEDFVGSCSAAWQAQLHPHPSHESHTSLGSPKSLRNEQSVGTERRDGAALRKAHG